MLKNILTGGIDLPELQRLVHALSVAVIDNRQELNAALGDHIAKANARLTGLENLVAGRATAYDLETLKQRVERLSWEALAPEGDKEDYDVVLDPKGAGKVDVSGAKVVNVADAVAATDAVNKGQLDEEVHRLRVTVSSLSATVSGLQSQIATLTAAKLSEVKARKAPKK